MPSNIKVLYFKNSKKTAEDIFKNVKSVTVVQADGFVYINDEQDKMIAMYAIDKVISIVCSDN